MKTIRILISSPGDVAEERDRARQVVEQLRRRYVGQFDLKTLLWEDLPLQADMSFQQGIDLVISPKQGVDIAVFILWSRLGSPTGPLIQKPNGGQYRSGTERELDLIMAAKRDNKKRDPTSDAPKILVYTRRDESSFDECLRGKSTDEKNQLLAQKKLVETFILEEFHDIETGTNVRAHHTFDRPVAFSQVLRKHLQEILDELASGLTVEPVWDVEKLGSPFRGLEAFEFEHNSVFFGREDEVLEVHRALQQRARAGCAFVLVSGASGSGKSSLVRAGVVPAIVEQEVDNVVIGWRYLVCTPAQFAGDLCGGLARLLCSKDVLPETMVSADKLAEGFKTAPPNVTVDQSIRPALAAAAQGKLGATRLLVLVDQMEELFTDKNLTDRDRDCFVSVLEALASSGVAWVLATVRSDFYQQCQGISALMRMKQSPGPSQIDLLPPEADALGELIRQPAKLAGLRFEEMDGKSLAGRILDDAAANRGLLPLVSYLLRELFEQRTPGGLLTFASYRELGGIAGSLGLRAEQVFSKLPPKVQAVFGQVMHALCAVDLNPDSELAFARRHAQKSELEDTDEKRDLIAALVKERLLTTNLRGAAATITLTHETLLTAWPRLAKWISEHRELLRLRDDLEIEYHKWLRNGRKSSWLLTSSAQLEEGRTFLKQARTLLGNEDKPLVEYIADSEKHAAELAQKNERGRKQEKLAWVVGALVAIVLTILATASITGRKYGILIVTSDPPGSSVWVEGKKWGITPYTNFLVQVRQIELQVERDGFVPQTVSVGVKAGMADEIKVSLHKLEGVPSQVVMASGAGKLISFHGSVQLQRRGYDQPVLPMVGMMLAVGDRIKAGEFSDATIEWEDKSLMQLKELSTLEILPRLQTAESGRISILRGLLHFFIRDQGRPEIVTPTDNVRIEG